MFPQIPPVPKVSGWGKLPPAMVQECWWYLSCPQLLVSNPLN